jgi:hypothetical protein
LQATSRQLPDEHDEEAFAREHAVPQLPQLVALVSGASQPLAALPSQSPKPAEQVETPQTPPTQLGVPPVVEQTWPQVPQLLTPVIDVSQPLFGLPSQSAKPGAQVGAHVPVPEQLVEPWAFVQAFPQEPQFVTVRIEVSQPLASLLSQSPHPSVHATIWQPPVAHELVALARVQRTPQPPQLVELVSGASQPLVASPSQSPKPAAQRATPHAPLTQLGVPAVVEQILPQVPQLVTLLSDVSQPLAGLPSQSAKPVAHVGTHAPDVQATVPLAFVQVLPHAPQSPAVLSEVSHPLLASPSQSA